MNIFKYMTIASSVMAIVPYAGYAYNRTDGTIAPASEERQGPIVPLRGAQRRALLNTISERDRAILQRDRHIIELQGRLTKATETLQGFRDTVEMREALGNVARDIGLITWQTQQIDELRQELLIARQKLSSMDNALTASQFRIVELNQQIIQFKQDELSRLQVDNEARKQGTDLSARVLRLSEHNKILTKWLREDRAELQKAQDISRSYWNRPWFKVFMGGWAGFGMFSAYRGLHSVSWNTLSQRLAERWSQASNTETFGVATAALVATGGIAYYGLKRTQHNRSK